MQRLKEQHGPLYKREILRRQAIYLALNYNWNSTTCPNQLPLTTIRMAQTNSMMLPHNIATNPKWKERMNLKTPEQEARMKVKEHINNLKKESLQAIVERQKWPLHILNNRKHQMGICYHCHQNNCPTFLLLLEGCELPKEIYFMEKLGLPVLKQRKLALQSLNILKQRFFRRLKQNHPLRSCPALEGCPQEYHQKHREWYHHPLYTPGELLLKRSLHTARMIHRAWWKRMRLKIALNHARYGPIKPRFILLLPKPETQRVREQKRRIHLKCLQQKIRPFQEQPQWGKALSITHNLTNWLWTIFPSATNRLVERSVRPPSQLFTPIFFELPQFSRLIQQESYRDSKLTI